MYFSDAYCQALRYIPSEQQVLYKMTEIYRRGSYIYASILYYSGGL